MKPHSEEQPHALAKAVEELLLAVYVTVKLQKLRVAGSPGRAQEEEAKRQSRSTRALPESQPQPSSLTFPLFFPDTSFTDSWLLPVESVPSG